MKDLSEFLNQLKTELGFNQIQIGPLGTPVTVEFYERWLRDNLHGDMNYLQEHLDRKKVPQNIDPRLHSVISVTQPYFPAPVPFPNLNPARVATYAQNYDYHYWLKDKLLLVIKKLTEIYPGEVFLPFVDSGPVLERNWGYQNALGWFGKNTCLIHPKDGSLFFIAEILTSLKIEETPALEPLPDFCGTCQKCMEICPTQAITSPRVLEAEKCISYLTIESKKAPPVKLREKIGDWFFGCDLCQTVCPWNQKVFRKKELTQVPQTSTENFLNLSENEAGELGLFFQDILESSNKSLEKKFWGSPLLRAGGAGLKRNALIVIANRKMKNLKPSVEKLKDHPKWAELVEWTLTQLS